MLSIYFISEAPSMKICNDIISSCRRSFFVLPLSTCAPFAIAFYLKCCVVVHLLISGTFGTFFKTNDPFAVVFQGQRSVVDIQFLKKELGYMCQFQQKIGIRIIHFKNRAQICKLKTRANINRTLGRLSRTRIKQKYSIYTGGNKAESKS